jgi:pimeloyl-ACP methyl ester carboxylesterase
MEAEASRVRRAGARAVVALALLVAAAAFSPPAPAQPQRIGVVVMHGKGGLPTGYVAELASFLEGKGVLVANLEMPWSGRRNYDAAVDQADREVDAALADLRAKGAAKVFVAGHSQGGLYALHFGGKGAVDGIVAIAPGGNVANAIFRDKLGDSVSTARRLVAEGRGAETTRLFDFEGAKGVYPVVAAPADYLTWFDPDGAMNQLKATKAVNPKVPVLFIVPKSDYPGLLRVRDQMFGALPRNPRTRLYEPDADHVRAPAASREEILRWATEVAGAPAAGRP